MRHVAIGLLGLLWALPLRAQEDPMQGLPSASAEYQRIAAERSRENAGFDAQEAGCYGRFAVNACLKEVQSRRRAMLADLKRQEASLHDAERLQKGADRLRASEQKALDRQEQDVQAGQSAATVQQRLQAQQEKQAEHAASALPVPSENRELPVSSGPSAKEQASQRERYAAKQAQAEKKRQELARRLKEKGAKPVPGLPVPD
jgi:hypothetical protein